MTNKVHDEKFVVCESADGYSIHAPGSTDEAIASGDAPYLVSEAWEDDDRVIPASAYDRAKRALKARALTTYEVTASNAFFWQKLAVEAADAEAAAKAFRDYLAEPAQQESEAYELEQAQQLGFDYAERASYCYRFKDDAVEESNWDEASDHVRLIGSGGNG